ncbi:hypothetical protein B296_00016729 [Ensete ventricosum]|uniref:Fe2OG dioxygenase domain-containing protein n=1 Tax=Ensete ventricosum TaxID=4639 RepID=A0A427AES2_ENSVE|nr:hypothetical protein B296_00016729 [Ensete ventricosum]
MRRVLALAALRLWLRQSGGAFVPSTTSLAPALSRAVSLAFTECSRKTRTREGDREWLMEDDSFVQEYEPSELEIAAEFLTNWLPFLTRGLCDGCSAALRSRIHSLRPGSPGEAEAEAEDPAASVSAGADELLNQRAGIQPTEWDPDPPASSESPRVRMSWADMAQEDELEEAAEGEEDAEAERRSSVDATGGESKGKGNTLRKETGLSREQREEIRFKNVVRKKDFICLERVKGKIVNILDGLELHTGVFSAAEQKRIVDFDKNGNPPGILKNVVADPVPHLFKVIIRRLVRWHVIPRTCIPDSCIVNIYELGDSIPPHIDNHDFVRPFCTVSFLSECDILFGSSLQIAGSGEFPGSVAVPLPVGSVLVLNGNAADVAKHCIPAVPLKRKMDESKWPVGFLPAADLQDIQPLEYTAEAKGHARQDKNSHPVIESKSFRKGKRTKGRPGAMKPGPNFFQDRQRHSNDSGIHARRSNLDGQSPGNSSSNSFERGSISGQRITESKFRPEFQGFESQEVVHSPTDSTAHVQQGEEDTGNVDRREHGGRTVRLERRRIIISSSMEGGDEDLAPANRFSDLPRVSRVQVRSLNSSSRRKGHLVWSANMYPKYPARVVLLFRLF